MDTDGKNLLAEADRRIASMKQLHHAERRAAEETKVMGGGEIESDVTC